MLNRLLTVATLDMVGKAISALGIFMLIRHMESGDFAAYALIFSLSMMISSSVSGVVNRLYNINRVSMPVVDSQHFHVQVILTAACIAVIGVISCPNSWDSFLWWSLCLALAVSASAFEFARSLFQRAGRFFYYGALDMLRSILTVAIWLTLIFMGGASWITVVMAQIGGAGCAIGLAVMLSPSLRQKSSRSRNTLLIRKIFCTKAILLASYVSMTGILVQLPIFLLEWFCSTRDVAEFGSASRYYGLLLVGLNAAHVVLLPAGRGREGSLDTNVKLGFIHFFALFSCFAIGAILLAGWWIPIIDAGRYPGSINAFRLLGMAAVIAIVFSPVVNRAVHLEKFGMLLLSLICGILFLFGSFFLAHEQGAVSAALALLIGGTSAHLILWGFLRLSQR